MAWLTAKMLGAPNWLWLVMGVCCVGIIAYAYIEISNNKTNAIIEVAKDSGKTEAIASGQAIVIEQVGKANEATTAIRSDTNNIVYDECLRNVAPGYAGNCERYKTK